MVRFEPLLKRFILFRCTCLQPPYVFLEVDIGTHWLRALGTVRNRLSKTFLVVKFKLIRYKKNMKKVLRKITGISLNPVTRFTLPIENVPFPLHDFFLWKSCMLIQQVRAFVEQKPIIVRLGFIQYIQQILVALMGLCITVAIVEGTKNK